MQTIKAKVIMLPTKDKPTKGSILLRHLWKDTKLECRSVWQYNETKQLSHTAVYTTLNGSFMDAPSSFKPQHIYLTTDEEIEAKDWFIRDLGSVKAVEKYIKDDHLYSGDRKIVATTDKSLNFPQIPQEFLKEYCETDGKIDEVEIEIELKSIPVNKEMTIAGYITYHDLKLDSNNCVIVHTVKKFWTKEEVEDILFDISTELSWDDKDEDELILSCQSKIEEIKKNL